MGLFSKVFGFVEDIFSAIGDVFSWMLGIPDEDEYEGQLLNKSSNVANIPVIYGKRLVGGTRAFVSTGGNKKNQYMYIVLALSEGEVESIDKIYVNDKLQTGSTVSGKPYKKVTTGDYKNLIWYQTFTGAESQTACTTLFNDIGGQGPDDSWTSAHKLNGVAYIAMVVRYHQDRGMTSIPEIRCEVKGRRVYNPDTGVTEWSDNPALCLRDYLTNTRYGKGLPDSAIDDDAFIAAASFCATPKDSYTNGPQVNVFSLNAIIDTSKTIFKNTQKILTAMRGIMPYTEGKYSILIDKDEESVGTITSDIVTKDISIKSTSKDKKLNQAKVVFVNPYKRWEKDHVIYPAANSAEETQFLAEDNNQILSKEITLDTVTNFYQARELARVIVLSSRSTSMMVSIICTSEALQYAVGDVIKLENESMGWTDGAEKSFRIMSMQLSVDGQVGLTLQEYDSQIYPWVVSTQEDDQPETTLPNPSFVEPVTNASATAGAQVLTDGTTQYYLDFEWDAPDDALVSEYNVEVTKKVGLVTTNNIETITTRANKARYIVTDTDAEYGFVVKAVNGASSVSDGFTVTPVATIADTTAPGDITGLSATGGLQSISLSWTNPTDADFDLVNIKVSDNNVEPANVFAQVRTNSYIYDVNSYSTTKYFWVAPVDRTGNTGSYTGPESATTGKPSYDDLSDKPTIPVIPEIATTVYLTLSDSNAPTDAEFSAAVGRDPIENDFVVVSYEALVEGETVTKTKAYVYKTVSPATVPDWAEVTEYIDGSMLVTGSLSASDITTGTLNANDVTISNLTVSYDSQVSDKPTIPTNVSELLNDSGFIDNTDVVFSDDLGDYIRLDSVENLLLSFDKYADQEANIDWTGYDSPTSDIKVVKSADAVTGGSYLEIGNNSGSDEAWLIHDRNIPFDPSQTYRVTVRAKQTAGTGIAYFGFAGVASDGTTLVNYTGADTHSSQHYFAGAAEDIPTTWTEYVGYVKGVGPTGTTEQRSDYNNPAVMHEDTRFVRPLILVNYSNKAGITLIDSFKIEAISANPNAIQGNEVDANVTEISGGVIQAGSQITVGTGNDIGALSGSDSTFRIWAGHATASSAPFRVSQAGTLYATNAVISGDITAGTINADNITFTGTLTADNLSGIPNVEALNMTQSMRNEIEEIIVTKFGSDASTGYYAEATGLFDMQDDDTEVCKILAFQHNGSDIDIDLTFSRSWQASSADTPSVEVNIQRAPAGTTTWTTIKTQTVTGSAYYEPELKTYIAKIQGYVSATDNPATGNYDYRFLTGNVLNLSLISLSAKLEANETGEQIGTIDLADYARIDQDETISGNYTFSGTTSGIDYGDLDNTPTIPTSFNILNGLADYVWDATQNARDWDSGLQLSFVRETDGYPSFGTVIRAKTYDNDGGNGEIYFPYSSVYGGEQLQYRVGKYNNAGMTSFRKIWDDNQFSSTDVSNWNTAYSWGDHASAGYLTTHQDISGKANLSGATFTGVVSLQQGQNDGLSVGGNKIRSVGDGLVINSDGIRFGDTSAGWDYDEWAGLKYYHPSKTIYFGGARASTSYWENNLGDTNDTKIDFVGVTDLSCNGTTFLDSDNNATFNKATISGKIQMEPDDTYTGYYAVGFQGTNTANGVNKIFAHGTGAGGMFVCSATSRSIFFRTNGSSNNTFTMTSDGDFQLDETTVIDASRNAYFTGARLASGSNLEWGGAYSNGYPTIASNSSGASGIMVFYPTGNTDGEIARLNNSGLSVNGTVNSGAIINDNTGAIRILHPDGASITTNGSTGAIKIRLPVAWTNTMMRMTVKVYEYATGGSFEVNVGGYNHTSSNGLWHSTFAQVISDPDTNRNFTVRYGHDGVKACIWIGETTSTWSYPKVAVVDFQAGHNNATEANWADGWEISFDTSLGTVQRTHSNNEVGIDGYEKRIGGTVVIDSSRNLTNIGTITSGRINNSEIYNNAWFRNNNSGQGLYNQANAMHWYSEDDTSYSIYSVATTAKIKFKTAGNVTRGYVYADDVSQIGFLNSSGSWTLKCDDSRNVSITNKLGVGGKFQFEPDDTYAGYYAIGFQGTSTANGVNKIFAHGTGGAGLFICSATSQSIYFRANGGGTNHFTITSGGNLQMSDTTVIDNSRNMYPTIIDMGSGHAQGYKFHGRSYSWNSAMQSPTTKMPHIWQEDYNGWDPVMGIKTTSGFWQMGAYSSNKIHFGYMAGAYGGHSSNSFDTSWAFTPTTFIVGDVGTMNLTVSGTITASSNITAYSDITLKDNIEVIPNALDKVCSVRGVTYERIDQDNARQTGVIAQEIEEILPEAVQTNDDGIKSVAYGNMVGILIEAIKELKAEIEVLKNGNNTN